MADPIEDVARRLDHIEQLLGRLTHAGPAPDSGPGLRSARSVVGRLDDVWVTVTEGNERVTAALADLGARVAGLEKAVEELVTGAADVDRQVAALARAARRERRAEGAPPPRPGGAARDRPPEC